MEISLNGERRDVPDGLTAEALLASLDLASRRVALEINLEIVPRGLFPETLLRAGDRVEIVQAIGGG
ncbi:MAG: sulfur carrier protein ThiS [Pseudomonadota bacterium]|nr:sulfur carrier protein ThiS [Pseudomonadota bacterium]